MQFNEGKKHIYRAAKYIRTSCAVNEEIYGDSINSQSRIIDGFLLKYSDIEVCSERIDENYTGVNFERPAFKDMIADVLNGKIDCIICKDLTRLGRNFVDVGRFIRDFLLAYNVRFIAINDDVDTLHKDIRDDLLVSIKNVFSEYYSCDVSVKTRSSLDIRRRNGDYISALAIYGYQKDSADKHKLVKDEPIAQIVKSIFDMRIQGMSSTSIAGKLNDNGVSSPSLYRYGEAYFRFKEKPIWHPSTVLRILQDENYTGSLVQGKQTTYSFKNRKKVTRPKSGWVNVKNKHEAIITLHDFEIVKQLSQLDARTPPNKTTVYSFSGLLKCSCCGSNLSRKPTSSKGKHYTYYRCATGKLTGCEHPGKIEESTLFSEITDTVTTYIHRICMVSPEDYERNLIFEKDNELCIAQKQLDKNLIYRTSLDASLENGMLSVDDYERLRRIYDIGIRQFENIITDLFLRRKSLSDKVEVFTQWLLITEKYLSGFELDRCTVIHLINKITVSSKGIYDVQFRYDIIDSIA